MQTGAIIRGESMLPSLRDGQHVTLVAPVRSLLVRCAVVIFRRSGARLSECKRIVGVPGDRLQIVNGRLIVNGSTATLARTSSGDYIENGSYLVRNPIRHGDNVSSVLQDDEYFALGDNRQRSDDSRLYGAISISEIQGVLTCNVQSSHL